MNDQHNDLYVAAVPGHLVARHGTAILIGATRDPREPSQISWNEELVVRIPAEEHGRYCREYDRAIRDGALKVCSQPEFEAMVAKLNASATKTAEAAKTEGQS